MLRKVQEMEQIIKAAKERSNKPPLAIVGGTLQSRYFLTMSVQYELENIAKETRQLIKTVTSLQTP